MDFRYLLVLALAIGVADCIPLGPPKSGTYPEDQVDLYFELFKTLMNRTYEDSDEEAFRFEIFAETIRKVNKLNSKREVPIYGLTVFADRTQEEKESFLGVQVPEMDANVEWTPVNKTFCWDDGETFDWRQQGIVSPVKSQGNCGSCWAFSAIGAVESQYSLKFKVQPPATFSEQQLLDCDRRAHGCDGGWPLNAYLSIQEYGGINTDADYQYVARQGNCQPRRGQLKVTTNAQATMQFPQDEEHIRAALRQYGPVSLGVNVGNNLYDYAGGHILTATDCMDSSPNRPHAVLAVGYGTRNGVKYWIIKNSWSTSWGEQGYLLLERGALACGVGGFATIPVVVTH